MFSMAKKKLQGDLIVALQYLKRVCNKAGEGLFIRERSDWTRGYIGKRVDLG